MAAYVNSLLSLPQARALVAAANAVIDSAPKDHQSEVLKRARDRLAKDIEETEDR